MTRRLTNLCPLLAALACSGQNEPSPVPRPDAGASEGSAATTADGGDATPLEPFLNLGVCGQRGEATVSRDAFQGFEEFTLIGEEGFGADICVVRLEVNRVGAAPGGCRDFAGQQSQCLWTHLVEYSNPRVLIDDNGVCADSELALDATAIAELDGSQVAYGYVSEYLGHTSVVMKHDVDAQTWSPAGNANWDAESSQFRFVRRNGFCGYR